jgi:TPR repeat protein
MKSVLYLAMSGLLMLGGALHAEEGAVVEMESVEAAYQSGDYATARAGLEVLAEAGDARAAYRLGFMIANGQGGPFDRAEAIKWLEAALAGQHNAGYTLLARAYMSGNPELPDYERAAELLEQSVALDDADAHFYLAQLLRVGRGVEPDPQRAFQLMRKAGGANMPDAAFGLAEMYSRGEGTVQDEAQVQRWLLQAAELGHGEAQMSLYFNYSRGTGFPQNDALAAQWLQAAAASGHTLAERVYGTELLLGDGQTPGTDHPTGLALLTRAAQKGEPGAQSNLGYAYAQGIGVDPDMAVAAAWFKAAADQGLTRAALTLAELYITGEGVEQSTEAAIEYYRVAYLGRSEQAAQRLGILLVEGAIPGPEPEAGLRWVTAAAETGQAEALDWLIKRAGLEPFAAFQLGRILDEGLGTEPDPERAARYFLLAAEGAVVPAQERLADLFASGAGVEQDYVQAHKWANVASALGSETAADRRDLLSNLMTPEQVAEAQAAARAFLAAQ